jgi:hypothetical protein
MIMLSNLTSEFRSFAMKNNSLRHNPRLKLLQYPSARLFHQVLKTLISFNLPLTLILTFLLVGETIW